MNTAAATVQRQMTADECLDAIARRRIGLTCALNVWLASCELKSPRKGGRSAQRLVSAVASTPIGAVERLLRKLADEPTARKLFDGMAIED